MHFLIWGLVEVLIGVLGPSSRATTFAAVKARLDPAAAPKQSHPLGSDAEADYEDKWSSADRKSAAQKVDQVLSNSKLIYEALMGGRVHGDAYKGKFAHPPVVNADGAQGSSNPNGNRRSQSGEFLAKDHRSRLQQLPAHLEVVTGGEGQRLTHKYNRILRIFSISELLTLSGEGF